MRVAFLARATLFSDRGGDTMQIEKTAEGLRKLGVDVDVFSIDQSFEYLNYDLLHLFNVIRPADFLNYSEQNKVPFVLSTIYVNYAEADKSTRKDLVGKLSRIIGANSMEYLKVIARWIKNGEQIRNLNYLLLGHKSSVKQLLIRAKLLLPNSHSEMRRIEADYNIKNDYRAIPNAVNASLFEDEASTPWQLRKGVICVGRIEPRKNQLNLIKALSGKDIELLIIGKAGVNHTNYVRACKAAAGSNVKFLSQLPFDQLIHYFKTARVHVLPSWFETTGLSSLEAAALGCNVVVTTKGDTEEYFQKDAWYCNPADIKNIENVVMDAYNAEQNQNLAQRIQKDYVWDITAKKTLDAYKEVLKL